ncbi:hypothetical protein ACIRST_40570 [Kitasatospora sp. NPDC101447]|uniref:hypothetical protein n=1 Tax=Kitasatospora sp. NPDC101447 TaxID=3364102 RepID=UPI003824A224
MERWAYGKALGIAAGEEPAVVEVVAAALDALGREDSGGLGRVLWHLGGTLTSMAHGDDGVDVVVAAFAAVAVALGAERRAWRRDTVVRVTGGEYGGRAGTIDCPVWDPDHKRRTVADGAPTSYRVRLGDSLAVVLPAGQLRPAGVQTYPGVHFPVAFTSTWTGCLVWGERLLRHHSATRGAEDPVAVADPAALLLAAALLDAATTAGLADPADGSALLDVPLPAVAALLAGHDDTAIQALLERTRPPLAATAQPLDALRALWDGPAVIPELHHRRRVQRLAHTVIVTHQAAGQRPDTDPDDHLTGRSVVRLRDRLDTLAAWEHRRRAEAWAALLLDHNGDDR